MSVHPSVVAGNDLVRIPSDSIIITKEKVKNGRSTNVYREKSRPSHGGSAQLSGASSRQTSGRTTPIGAVPHRMMSEAALRVNASLSSRNDR